MMRPPSLLLPVLLAAACGAPAPVSVSAPVDRRETLERDLEEARAAWREDPDDELAGIWVGRRLAYLGRTREAVEWYTERLAEHPGSVRLLRHRGHRLLTLREYERAEADLARAAELARDMDDALEPDGAPNRHGVPRSTTLTNVWYHLGLAHYLQGEDEEAAGAWRRCLELAPNGDMRVAAGHWLYLTLRRLRRPAEARALVEGIDPGLDVIENHAYADALRLYRGELLPAQVLERHPGGLGLASAGYGVAAWRLAGLDRERAGALLERIAREAPEASFGRMAAEADLERLGQ